MTSDEVKMIIQAELVSISDIKNVFGVDLTKCLIEPVKETYLLTDHETKEELWTVFVESPNGYRIFFDEEEKTFGMGTLSKDGVLYYFANYGTFLETLKGM